MASPLAGIGSSIDVNSLVSQLMAVERAPIDALATRTQKFQTKISALGNVKSALSSLQAAAQKLAEPASANPVTVTTGNSAVAIASSAGNAQPGRYSIDVQSLASTHKLVGPRLGSSTAAIGHGTLTIERGNFSGGTFTPAAGTSATNITIPPSANTLEGVRDAINGAGAGVTASIVNDGVGSRLVLASNDSGAANSIRMTVDDADGTDTDAAGLSMLAFDPAAATGSGRNLAEATPAADATFVFEGVSMTRPSNVITDVAGNVTLTLAGAGSTSLTVSRDAATTKTAVEALVSSYNSTMTTLKTLTNYDTATKTGGTLLGETVVRSVQARIRSIVGSPYGDASATYRTLSSIGIAFQSDGTLSTSGTKLSTALNASPANVGSLLGSVASALSTALSSAMATDGEVANRVSGIQSNIRRISDQQTQMESRMSAIESRYRRQFTALNNMVSSMTSTSDYLTTQLSALNKSLTGS